MEEIFVKYESVYKENILRHAKQPQNMLSGIHTVFRQMMVLLQGFYAAQ
jgi:hypothetical protein